MVVLVPLRIAMFFLLLLSAQLLMLWWRWTTPSGVQPSGMVQAERKLPYRHTFARYLLPTYSSCMLAKPAPTLLKHSVASLAPWSEGLGNTTEEY